MESMSLLYALLETELSDLTEGAKARTARPGKVTDSKTYNRSKGSQSWMALSRLIFITVCRS